MATVRQTLEKLSVAVGAADILRLSRSSAVDTSRQARVGFDYEKLLEHHKVMPVVAEIVDIDEAVSSPRLKSSHVLLRSRSMEVTKHALGSWWATVDVWPSTFS